MTRKQIFLMIAIFAAIVSLPAAVEVAPVNAQNMTGNATGGNMTNATAAGGNMTSSAPPSSTPTQ
jgi:hypothetical protein